MSTMRSPSMNHLHPRHSLRKIKTAFSNAPVSSSTASTASSRSPLSASATSNTSRFSGFDFGFSFDNQSFSSLSPGPRDNFRRVIRRKKSTAEIEQEVEQKDFTQLIGLIEPRPRVGAALGGIEEVLDGRV